MERVLELVGRAVVEIDAVVVERAQHAVGIERLAGAKAVPEGEVIEQIALRIGEKRAVAHALKRELRRLGKLAPLRNGRIRVRQDQVQHEQAKEDRKKAANQKFL